MVDGWHNDLGNDTCLTLYSDKETYYTDLQDPTFQPLFKIENDCGVGMVANLGIFFQNKDVQGVTIQNIQQAFDITYSRIPKTYKCQGTAQFSPKTKIGTCSSLDINGLSVFWQKEVTNLKNGVFEWNYQKPKYQFVPMDRLSTTKTKGTGEQNFNLKESIRKDWKSTRLNSSHIPLSRMQSSP